MKRLILAIIFLASFSLSTAENLHVYIGIESLSLTDNQRNTLVDALKALAPNLDRARPAERNHWRIRPDGDAVIFEARFNQDHISISAVKGYLANVFDVDVANISHTVTSTAYGPLITLRYNSVNRLRLIQFGGASPTWDESRVAATAYLKANSATWETGP